MCVFVRSGMYAEWGGDNISACRLPFIEIPRVAAVSPNTQEMTRRVTGWWIFPARATEHASTAHIVIIYPVCHPSGTNGIIITSENLRMMFIPWLSFAYPPVALDRARIGGLLGKEMSKPPASSLVVWTVRFMLNSYDMAIHIINPVPFYTGHNEAESVLQCFLFIVSVKEIQIENVTKQQQKAQIFFFFPSLFAL